MYEEVVAVGKFPVSEYALEEATCGMGVTVAEETIVEVLVA